jgi:hypothetical protein
MISPPRPATVSVPKPSAPGKTGKKVLPAEMPGINAKQNEMKIM